MRTRQGIVGEEQHASAERYIITYADLITLLLGLFVILYAASQVDLGKYREVAQAL
jgi:chemotaxis protein MotB